MKEPKALYLLGKKPIDNKTVYIKSEADRYIAWLKMKRCESKVNEYHLKMLLSCNCSNGWIYRASLRRFTMFKKLAEHYKELAK